ncbi:MAG: C4-type zinc ribbon domain-containing protein [Acidobacteriota bacterium]
MAPLETILALHQTLVELRDARDRLAGVPDWMSDLHDRHSARKAEIEAEQSIADDADRSRREAEAAVADARERLDHYQKQISQVTNQREYGALLKEIDTVKTEISEQEEAAVGALETAEEAQSKANEAREGFAELDATYAEELAKWEAQKPAVAERVDALEARAVELREPMAKPHQAIFDRLWQRTGGHAVSEVQRIEGRSGVMWHCTACSYNVRPQIAMEIRNGAIVQCESCKRILFWPPAPQEPDGAEA